MHVMVTSFHFVVIIIVARTMVGRIHTRSSAPLLAPSLATAAVAGVGWATQSVQPRACYGGGGADARARAASCPAVDAREVDGGRLRVAGQVAEIADVGRAHDDVAAHVHRLLRIRVIYGHAA